MLRLTTLGGVTLVGGSGAGIPTQRRRLALLCMLAPYGDRGLPRLDQLLYASRRQFGESLVLGPDPLRLNPELLVSDVTAFERLLSESALAEAVALYRGPFLDGFFLNDAPGFESWVEEERERLRGRYAAGLQSLVRRAEEQGRHAEGIEWRRRLAALDPLDGRIPLGLMRALAESGDRPGALRRERRGPGGQSPVAAGLARGVAPGTAVAVQPRVPAAVRQPAGAPHRSPEGLADARGMSPLPAEVMVSRPDGERPRRSAAAVQLAICPGGDCPSLGDQ